MFIRIVSTRFTRRFSSAYNIICLMETKKKYPIVAVDVIIFTIENQELKVVLIKMKKKPFKGMWAFPGGRVDTKESLNNAAKRELYEKAGVRDVYLEQLYTFGDVKRDPLGRIVSVAYYALVNNKKIRLKTTSKYAGIDWFSVKHIPRLAYDHKTMLKMVLQRLRWKLEYTNVVYSILPGYFTLKELQRVYEIILDKKLDKRNFRKKVLMLGLLDKTRIFEKRTAHRPAALYEFRKRKPMFVEIL